MMKRKKNQRKIKRPRSARKLLRRVADRIEACPEQYDQQTWGQCNSPAVRTLDDMKGCGTVGCVAGWGMLEHPKVMLEDEINIGKIGCEAVVYADRWWGKKRLGTVSTYEGITLTDVVGVHPDRDAVGEEMGLSVSEADILFHATWEPKSEDVPTALRRIADGAHVEDV